MPSYAIGIDFGTESGRVLLVDVADGREIATAVHAYANGVIDQLLPGSGQPLPPDWALQDPGDYIAVLQQAIPAVLQESGVDAADVIGVGIDFTSCTILPTLRDGAPLCRLPQWRGEPHAWVKLWKHHAAQPEADRINDLALARQEPWLELYGGKISSEWFFSKALQMLDEAPAVYHAAERIIEAADWIVWQLTGREVRCTSTAGFKAIWQAESGYPSASFLAALHPDFANIVEAKMAASLQPLGSRAGGLTEEAAAWTGLRPGTPVGVAVIDAFSAVYAGQTTAPGVMAIILGTSTCHMLIAKEKIPVPGVTGLVKDAFIPGYYGYEAGQAATGDILAWFVRRGVPPVYHEEAERRGISLYALLEEAAAQQRPGAHGLLALDWWNGVRSTLGDAELSGMLVGATLATTAPDIYRTLIEGTAYGTRHIVENFERHGVPVTQIVAAGGLAEQNRLLMQIYADVLNRELRVVKSGQAGALGAAVLGAVAAGVEGGGHPDLLTATQTMGGLRDAVYTPIAEHVAIYDQLYAEYSRLYQYFGKENEVMKTLRRLRNEN
ncbi:MAG TPA: ribulokinase [Caldilineaceae bacterium]|nr:ribulokinase [Caldilineaceae bacterium]